MRGCPSGGVNVLSVYHELLLFTCYAKYDHRQESLGNNVYHVQTRVKVHKSKVVVFLHVTAGLEITRSLVMVSYVTGMCGCPFLSAIASTRSCPGNFLYTLSVLNVPSGPFLK